MPELPFETLIKTNNSGHRWYPLRVESYQCAFKLDASIDNCAALRKNLAYSLQYLEFLEKEIAELHLSSVLCVMIYKTYVVTAMSVLEGLFTNIVKSNDWWKTTNLESLGTTTANETKFGEEKYVLRTEILKKIPPREDRMDLDGLIKILDSHHRALNVNHLVYPALRRLKNLRNRVHLQMAESSTDHDYNAFGYETKKEMGELLYTILTSEMVTDTPEVFDFLKVNLD